MAIRPRKPGPTTPTAAEVPVTSAVLAKVRVEILHRIDQAREEAKADNQRLDGKLDGVKAELKADILRLDSKIDGVKAELKADIQELRAEIHEVKAEIHEVKAEIHEVKAEIHEVKAGVARIEVLVEEQNTRNKIVLDGSRHCSAGKTRSSSV